MIKKAVLFTWWFGGDEGWERICKECGYDPTDIQNLDLMFDERIVQYVEEHSVSFFGKRPIYQGRPTDKMKIGFLGLAVVEEIDTSQNWQIGYSSQDIPFVEYVDVIHGKYNYVQIRRKKV